MTLKDLFKKVETYNEIAEMMRTYKAKIYFCDSFFSGEHFDTFEALRKYARKEYIKDLADRVLKFDGWEFDKGITFEWTDSFGDTMTVTLTAELVCA